MKFDAAFLRSKVARRIFVLFVLCALLPIASLAIISFSQVTKQLKDQCLTRLQQASKALGMATFERLSLLETEMKMIASTVRTGGEGGFPASHRGLAENLEQRFNGVETVTEDGRRVPVAGHIQNPPAINPEERQHILSGKTVVSTPSRSDSSTRVYMSCALDPQNPSRGILLAEINTSYLWNVDTLPPQTELCVLDNSQSVLLCTPAIRSSFGDRVPRKIISAAQGQFEWNDGSKDFLASYWSLPLRYIFFTPRWTLVVSESKADALAPITRFKATFPLVILMALWVVLLLSIIQIRRSLVPLEKLQEGTRLIAMRHFDSRVTVTSDDEFAELATSFNAMSQRLGRQFNALTTMKEIDRAVLSALDREKIVETVLTRLPEVLPCDFASVTLLDPESPSMVRTYVPGVRREENWWRMPVRPEDMQKLCLNRESLLIEMQEHIPSFLRPLMRFGVNSILLLPIFLEGELSGIINVGYRNSPEYSQDDLAQARQLADQVAVALSNARLIEKLDQLNWGTLTALARAIDAKSAWTSGHSERVTKLALHIARVMGYAGKDLERMNRGGLLHDIGKIGTPPTVLDKPGKLDAEELRLMREHVRMGAHILKPIPGFAEIMPIVLQHHEWFDGSGYPDGLAGEAISLDARIFAVADCFDALASDRPYRSGLPRERVIEMIKQGSGHQYDPRVIEAFLKVMEEQDKGKSKGAAEPGRRSLTPELDVSGPVEEDFSIGEADGSKHR